MCEIKSQVATAYFNCLFTTSCGVFFWLYLPHCVPVYLCLCHSESASESQRGSQREKACVHMQGIADSSACPSIVEPSVLNWDFQYLTVPLNMRFHSPEFLKEFTCWFISQGESKTIKEFPKYWQYFYF